MTVEVVSRLEGALERLTVETNSFVRSTAEFNNTVTIAIKDHDELLRMLSHRVYNHEEIMDMLARNVKHHDEIFGMLNRKVYDHDKMIERLDRMIACFDEWLRGQGPTDGHEKRNPGGEK